MVIQLLEIIQAVQPAAVFCLMLAISACGSNFEFDTTRTSPSKPPTPVKTIITLSATPQSSGRIALSWNAVGSRRDYSVRMNDDFYTSVTQFDEMTPVTFKTDPLDAGKQYCFKVVAYTFSPYFYVGESEQVCVVALADEELPIVSYAYPPFFAPVNTSITASFSEPIDPQTVTSTSFVVSGPSGPITGNLQASPDSATFIFEPSEDLPFSSSIAVTITTEVKDRAGNALASNYSWTFNTYDAPDTSAPTIPTGFSTSRVGASEVDLFWIASVDDVGVAGYKLYRDNIYVQLVTNLAYLVAEDRGLNFNTQYCYSISAYDFSGNESAQSAPLCVTTLDFLPGTVATWGHALRTNGSFWHRTIPDVITNLDSVSAISAQASLALKSDGTVWDLGRPELTQVPDLSNVIAVAGGHSHWLAATSDGLVWGWGDNRYGALGDGTFTSYVTPVQMMNLSEAVAVATGISHSLALKSDGSVWATGGNWFGQLGIGTTETHTTAVQVLTPSSIIAIAASYNGSLALRAEGTVWAWGDTSHAPTYHVVTPIQVPDISDIIGIAQGIGFSLAVKSDGTVWSWGHNGSGQLGDGTTTSHTTPAVVPGLSNAIAVAAGYYHSLALTADGTVWAWGANSDGQLGDGTTINKSVPVQVLRVSGASAIAAGRNTSLALRN